MFAVNIRAAIDGSNIDGENGTLYVSGDLNEGACWLDSGSEYQHVELGAINTSALVKGNNSAQPVNFMIKLRDCLYYAGSLTDTYSGNITWSSKQPLIKVSFTTEQDQKYHNLIDVTGMASGIALRLNDVNNRVVNLNDYERPQFIDFINNKLTYKVHVVKTSDKLIVGNYRATVNFKVDYD